MLDGRDPSAARRLDKINAAISEGNTFETLAADDMARLAARESAPATIAKVKWLLEGLAGPALGKRAIAEITPVEILALLQQVERSGRRESARRLRSTIGCVFRFAIATLRAQTDPTSALRDALERPKVKHRFGLESSESTSLILASARGESRMVIDHLRYEMKLEAP